MSKKKDDDYEVGYGKPPKHSRFQKGRSGNPKGRPKGAKDVETMLRDTLYRKVVITENGKRKEVAALEAFFRQTLKGSLVGDSRAADKLVKLLPILRSAQEREAVEMDALAAEAARDDGPVLEALAALMGGEIEDLFLADQIEAPDA